MLGFIFGYDKTDTVSNLFALCQYAPVFARSFALNVRKPTALEKLVYCDVKLGKLYLLEMFLC